MSTVLVSIYVATAMTLGHYQRILLCWLTIPMPLSGQNIMSYTMQALEYCYSNNGTRKQLLVHKFPTIILVYVCGFTFFIPQLTWQWTGLMTRCTGWTEDWDVLKSMTSFLVTGEWWHPLATWIRVHLEDLLSIPTLTMGMSCSYMYVQCALW